MKHKVPWELKKDPLQQAKAPTHPGMIQATLENQADHRSCQEMSE